MSFGGFSRQNSAPMSEINTTPLVDVMLVLLIIFIITAPMITSSINVNLPSNKNSASIEKPNIINLSLDINGKLFWNGKEIDQKNLPQLLSEAVKNKPETELRLQADRDIRYQKVMEIMSEAQKAGITKLGFVSRVEK